MHRGDSHALFWLSVAALPLGAAIAALQRERALQWRWILAAWLALVTHPLLDAMTICGTQLLRPFSTEPLGLGSVFIIDPLYTLALLIGAGVALRSKASALRWNAAGLLLSCAYLAWSAVAQQQVLQTARTSLQDEPQIEHLMATPAPFNTLLWRVVAITPDHYMEAYHSLIAPSQRLHFTRHNRGAALFETLRSHPPVATLAAFSHDFFKLEHTENGEILMADLRMGRDPGDFFRFVVAREPSPLQKLDRPEAAGPSRARLCGSCGDGFGASQDADAPLRLYRTVRPEASVASAAVDGLRPVEHQGFDLRAIQAGLQFVRCSPLARGLGPQALITLGPAEARCAGGAAQMVSRARRARSHQGRATGRAMLQRNAVIAVADDGIEGAGPPHAHEGRSQRSIELLAQLGLDDVQRLGSRHARAIGTGACHRIKSVAETHQTGVPGNLGIEQAQGIAPPIGHLVMVMDHADHQFRQGMADQHARAHPWMRLDGRELLVGEPSRLAQDGIGDAHLAQVVQEARHGDAARLARRAARLQGQGVGHARHTPEMSTGVGVARLDHPRRDQQACQQGLALQGQFLAQALHFIHMRFRTRHFFFASCCRPMPATMVIPGPVGSLYPGARLARGLRPRPGR